jgi:hypothetical protein
VHRNQFTEAFRKLAYGDDGAVDAYVADERALQGYCETTSAGSRPVHVYCRDAYQTPLQRSRFCANPETQLLANNIYFGLFAPALTEESACSSTHKLCFVMPSSASDVGKLDTYTSSAPGRPARTGYTILASPGLNHSFVRRFLLPAMLLPIKAIEATPHIMRTRDDVASFDQLDANDEGVQAMIRDTYGIHLKSAIEMVLMTADLELYIESKCNTSSGCNAESIVKGVVNDFVDNIFDESNKCPDDDGKYYVPDHTEDGTSSKTCVTPAEVLQPWSDVLVDITTDGITLKSAYGNGPIRPVYFKGFQSGAATCERFMLSASNVTLQLAVDQAGCEKFADDGSFKLTPVKLVGIKVVKAHIVLQLTTPAADHVAVAVLGRDSEQYNVPAQLEIDDVRIHVVLSETCSFDDETFFDVAVARVVPASAQSNLKVVCSTFVKPDNPQKLALNTIGNISSRPCELLVQGVQGNQLDALYSKFEDSNGATTLLEDRYTYWEDLEYNTPCLETIPGKGLTANNDTCTYVNVTKFTSMFGLGFEQREFVYPLHHENGVIALSVIVGLLFVGLVMLNVALMFTPDANFVAYKLGLQDVPLTAQMLRGEHNRQQKNETTQVWRIAADNTVSWEVNADGAANRVHVVQYSQGISVADLYTIVVNADLHPDENLSPDLQTLPAALREYVLQVYHDSVPLVLLESKKNN